MEFFVPYVEAPDKAEEVWRAVATFAESQGFGPLTERRIFRLEYMHDSREMEAQVGEPHPYGHPYTWEYKPDYDDPKAGEWVVAILEAESGLYLVCTHNRGVVRGEPILVGESEPYNVIYFDDYGPDSSAR